MSPPDNVRSGIRDGENCFCERDAVVEVVRV
jgi:hypothetical protein